MLPFPSDTRSSYSDRDGGGRVAHTRVNSSPALPDNISHWAPHIHATPSRLRAHLRSLDLASASPPATPSHLTSLAHAQKSAVPASVPRSASSYTPAYALSTFNIAHSADSDSAAANYFDLSSSPGLPPRALPPTRAGHPSSATRSAFDSPRRASHPPILGCSPTAARGQHMGTPPLTPSSSFTSTSASLAASSDVERDDEAENTLHLKGMGAHPRAEGHWIHGSGDDVDVSQPGRRSRYDVQVEAGRVKVRENKSAALALGRREDEPTAFPAIPFPSARLPHSPARTHYDDDGSVPVPDSPTPVRGCRASLDSGFVKSRTRSTSLSASDVSPTKGAGEERACRLLFSDAENIRSPDSQRHHTRSTSVGPRDETRSPPAARHAYVQHRQQFYVPPPHSLHVPYDPRTYLAQYPTYPTYHPHPMLGHPQHFDATHGLGASDGHAAVDEATRQAVMWAPAHEHHESADAFAAPPALQQEHTWAGPSEGLYHARNRDRNGRSGRFGPPHAHPRNRYPTSVPSAPASPPPLPPPTNANPAHAPPDKNVLNIAAIESGVDTRTTVMIKNIPNKMSDVDLLRFLGREGVARRRIDFFYLRMDFGNGCNVGYAFVNFITVQDLLHFAKTQLGVKWNMYSSEKVLQLSYANYQGKEALIEKFRNSAIMDERPAWRPRIFCSDGPRAGEPEPFPDPTHLRRKERSASNKGALFVPGGGSAQGHGGARRMGGQGWHSGMWGPR